MAVILKLWITKGVLLYTWAAAFVT